MYTSSHTCEAKRAFAGVVSDGIVAGSSVSTRTGDAVVDVNLAPRAGEADGAGAFERVDEIVARAAVQTGPVLAFVYVDLALCPSETCKKKVLFHMQPRLFYCKRQSFLALRYT